MASVILRDGRAADVASASRPTAEAIERSRRLGALRMRRQGVRVGLIARHYGVTRQTIHNWLRAIPAEAAELVAF